MMQNNNEISNEKVCNLGYVVEMTGGNKQLIKDIIDTYIKQVPEELQSIKDGIAKTDYKSIRSYAHTMKSTVSIMGITVLKPILQEMQDLGTAARDMEKIKELDQKLNLICNQSFEEIEKEKIKYL